MLAPAQVVPSSATVKNIVWFISLVALLVLNMFSVMRLDREVREGQIEFERRIVLLEQKEQSSRQLVISMVSTIQHVAQQLESKLLPMRTFSTQRKSRIRNRVKRDLSLPPKPRNEENQEELQRTIHSLRREMFSLNDRCVSLFVFGVLTIESLVYALFSHPLY